MRVLLVHNRYRSAQPSGENVVVDDEAALLEAAGHIVERFEFASDDIAAYSMTERLALPSEVVWSRRAAAAIEECAARFEPDVAHIHNTFPLISPSVFWRLNRLNIPAVQTLHNFRGFCAASTLLYRDAECDACVNRMPIPAIRRRCYRGSAVATTPIAAMNLVHRAIGTWNTKVALYLCPSKFLRDKYVEAGWPAEKLVVKYNTAPNASVTRTTDRSHFIAIGRLVREKGFDLLIRAWRDARLAGERLLIVGEGDEKAELMRLAHGDETITFTGQIPHGEAMEHLQLAKATIVPSRWYEVFPRVIAESYARGVPVIASAIGSLRELVDPQTGHLFEPGNSSSLSQALSVAQTTWPTQALAARNDYEQLYSPDVTIAALEQAYSQARGTVAVAQPA